MRSARRFIVSGRVQGVGFRYFAQDAARREGLHGYVTNRDDGCVGLECGDARTLPLNALGRALGRTPAPWPVNLIVLDIAQDPVGDWLRTRVNPFYQRQQ